MIKKIHTYCLSFLTGIVDFFSISRINKAKKKSREIAINLFFLDT